jgi:hypothetical protein
LFTDTYYPPGNVVYKQREAEVNRSEIRLDSLSALMAAPSPPPHDLDHVFTPKTESRESPPDRSPLENHSEDEEIEEQIHLSNVIQTFEQYAPYAVSSNFQIGGLLEMKMIMGAIAFCE